MTDFLLPRTDKIKSFHKANPDRGSAVEMTVAIDPLALAALSAQAM
jgi:hypothetical protein